MSKKNYELTLRFEETKIYSYSELEEGFIVYEVNEEFIDKILMIVPKHLIGAAVEAVIEGKMNYEKEKNNNKKES